MSAWIVPKETIDRVVTALLILNERYPGHPSFHPVLDNIRVTKGEDGLGKALWEMNKGAVNQRYGGRPVKDLPGHKVTKYAFERSQDGHHQIAKSIHCFGYQCSEGDVPDTELYKAVELLENSFNAFVVMEHPDYKAAEWR